MPTDFIVIIPARLESSRLPHKVLADIAGQSMIERVYKQACLSKAKQVYIATDSDKVANAAEAFGAKVYMTRPDHPSGTERLAEVASQIACEPDTIIVNVQGDEPLIEPANINQVADLLAGHKTTHIATLATLLNTAEALYNTHAVKVVTDVKGRALYFSRATIPWWRGEFDGETPDALPENMPYPIRQHVGIYAYHAAFLKRYVTLAACPLEQMEHLEQLRALWYGYHIQVADAVAPCFGGIDTEEDLTKIRAYIALVS